MKLEVLVSEIAAKVVTSPPAADITHVYAGDRISDLLNHAGSGTLLVTNIAGTQLLRLAELMDVPAICLLNDVIPDDELVRAAAQHGTALVVAPGGMFETCGRLYEALKGD